MFRNLFPTIPNLEFGYQYFFGKRVRSGQASADYVLPYRLNADSVVFGEAHGDWWDFGNRPSNGASNRVDLPIGGGYRCIVNRDLFVGVNGFFDSSRLFNSWSSSGGVGLEMAAKVGDSDAFDLNANWYGNVFSANDILNAFRNKGGSFDVEAGYSHALFNSQYDLRLKFAGYKFDTGSNIFGYKTGAELTTRDGMFTLRYEYGYDRLNQSWNNVGAFVNIGFQVENLAKGESPFTMPEPVFRSPRNLQRMFTQKVKRDWNQSYAPKRLSLASSRGSSGSFVLPGFAVIATEIKNDAEYPLSPEISLVSKPIAKATQYWYGLTNPLPPGGGSDVYIIITNSEGLRTKLKPNNALFQTASGEVQIVCEEVLETVENATNTISFTGLDRILEFSKGGGTSVVITEYVEQ